MAKISARGATKIAQHSIEYRDADGWDHKVRLALRSDGRVLRAHDLRVTRRLHGARSWNRGSYSIITGVRLNASEFDAFAGRFFRAMHGTMRNAETISNTTI